MLEAMSSAELTEWGLFFELKNEEAEERRDGEVIEHRGRDDDEDDVDDDG